MKKRNIIHSALSLSLTAALCLSMAACGGTQPPADSSAASAAPAQPAAVQPAAEEPTSTALPVKALHPKQVDENPYMAKSDANIHHDGYNTDSTDEVLPLGIYPEINVSYEKPTRTLRLPFTLTATATQSFLCSAASPSAI